MSICKRNDRYSFRVYVYDHDRGKNRQIERRGFLTKKEAKIAEAKFLSDYEMNNSLKKHVLSFETVFEYYFTQKSKQWKETTIFDLRLILTKRILEYFKNHDISKITTSHINAWRNDLNGKGYAQKYKNKLLTHLKGIFEVAHSEFNLSKNIMANEPPFKDYELIHEKESIKRIYTEDEFKKYQSVISNNMYELFFTLLFYTGLRIGEIRAIKWKDLNRDAGSIIINKQVTNKTKNKKAIEINPKTSSSVREVYYPIAHIEHLIKKYENECNVKNCDLRDFYIFGGKIPLAETTIRRKNDLHASKSGLDRIKIHDFRHSYITMCYNKNLDVLTTKDQVGHSSIKTTLDIYTTLDHKQRQLNIKNAFDEK